MYIYNSIALNIIIWFCDGVARVNDSALWIYSELTHLFCMYIFRQEAMRVTEIWIYYATTTTIVWAYLLDKPNRQWICLGDVFNRGSNMDGIITRVCIWALQRLTLYRHCEYKYIITQIQGKSGVCDALNGGVRG